jgi:hypothetical protein
MALEIITLKTQVDAFKRAQEPGGQPLDLTLPGNDSKKAVRSF